jgi:large subunit ribosomal protein L1
MKISEALMELKKGEKKNFIQSVDMIVNLKNIDLKKPENRISVEVKLPHSPGNLKVCVIGDELAKKAKNADKIIDTAQFREIFADKKKIKRLAEDYDFFMADVSLMAEIGRLGGPILAKRNKMPIPVPPNVDVEEKIKQLKSTIFIRVRDNPSLQFRIGKENMDPKEIAENFEHAINVIKEKLPKKEKNLKNAYVKLTMGKPCKVEVG